MLVCFYFYEQSQIFVSSEIDLFVVSNKHFIFNETQTNENDDEYNSVTIINRSNGLVKASFVILEDFHQIRLYLDKFLIKFNRETCLLKCYNFKGDLLGRITLDEKFEASYFSVMNKELCFAFDATFFTF